MDVIFAIWPTFLIILGFFSFIYLSGLFIWRINEEFGYLREKWKEWVKDGKKD